LKFGQRLASAWQILTNPHYRLQKDSDPETADNEELLQAESGIASLKLELAEARKKNAELVQQIALEKDARRDAVQTGLEAKLLPFLKEAGMYLCQLNLQASLLAQNKPLQPGDVLALTKGLERGFEKMGLLFVGQPFTETDFELDKHQNISGGSLPDGAKVEIRIPGCSFGGRILRKAMVQNVSRE